MTDKYSDEMQQLAVDITLHTEQLATMSAASQAFDRALELAEENDAATMVEAAHKAIREAREAWQAAAQEVGRRVHMQGEIITGRYS